MFVMVFHFSNIKSRKVIKSNFMSTLLKFLHIYFFFSKKMCTTFKCMSKVKTMLSCTKNAQLSDYTWEISENYFQIVCILSARGTRALIHLAFLHHYHYHHVLSVLFLKFVLFIIFVSSFANSLFVRVIKCL